MAKHRMLTEFTCPNRCISLEDRASWLALKAVLEAHMAKPSLPLSTLRSVVLAKTLLETGEATVAELREHLGDNWAICRATPRTRAKYDRCITQREYDEAQRKAINARVNRLMLELASEKMQQAA